MKKVIIMVGLLYSANLMNAQWSGTNPLYTNSSVGIGTSSPSKMLEINTGNAGDGLKIKQTSTYGGAVGLHMDNASTNGHHWTFYSLGYSDGWGGPGCFALQDETGDASNPRLFIMGNGNTAIGGSYNPADSRLYVSGPTHNSAPANPKQGGMFDISTSVYGTFSGVQGKCSSSYSGGNAASYVGVYGEAYGANTSSSKNAMGVYGYATQGGLNYGGYFYVPNNNVSQYNHGVYAEATNYTGYSNSWAGYFVGNVYRSGTDNFTSDRKLKKDIAPLNDALKKIMQLKPSTYQFKTDEFKNMGLPQGKQMGLIAQDLEEVFPELVTNMPAVERTNDKGETVSINPEFKSVQYVSLIPVLIAGMKEQQFQIEDQQKQISELKNLVKSLTAQSSSGSLNGTNTGLGQSVALSDKNNVVLDQNIPNPFAENTMVKYNIPQDFSKAQMIFTNVEGKVIKSVDITSKGAGSLNVFASDLSSGIYSYSLIVDGKTIETKKMIKQ